MIVSAETLILGIPFSIIKGIVLEPVTLTRYAVYRGRCASSNLLVSYYFV